MSKIVCLESLDSYDIEIVQQAVESSFLKLNVEQILKNIKKVMLKVCLPTDTSPDMAKTTHPSVVRAVVNILSKYGIKCVVADSPYGSYSVSSLDKIYYNTGMLEVANQTNCVLNHNLKICNIETPNGVATKKITLIDVVNDVDAVINISKLKMDDNFGFWGATSNLFGLVPGDVKVRVLNGLSTLKDFYNYNLDLYSAIENKLLLNIVDGVVAMEAENTPRMLSCLAVGESCFSVDEALLEVLDINKEKTILNQADKRGMFNLNKVKILSNKPISEIKVEDFALVDFDEKTLLHKNENERKKYYMRNQKRVEISKNKCKGCGICTKICPTKALVMKYDKNGELYTTIDYEKCIFCYKCVTACPYKVVDTNEPSAYKKLQNEIEKYN